MSQPLSKGFVLFVGVLSLSKFKTYLRWKTVVGYIYTIFLPNLVLSDSTNIVSEQRNLLLTLPVSLESLGVRPGLIYAIKCSTEGTYEDLYGLCKMSYPVDILPLKAKIEKKFT